MQRCENCLAPLPLDENALALACTYCSAMTRNESGAHLAETVAFLTSSGARIPVLEKDARLPIHKTELLSTAEDGQQQLRVHLVQGQTSVIELVFPLTVRAPRGVPKIGLTIRVSTAGELSLTVSEPETSNVLDRGGLAVLIR
jgi:molecular chaperone DnaK (HSP70)